MLGMVAQKDIMEPQVPLPPKVSKMLVKISLEKLNLQAYL